MLIRFSALRPFFFWLFSILDLTRELPFFILRAQGLIFIGKAFLAALITVIAVLIFVSFTCSILESSILSITDPYIQTLIDKHMRSGKILRWLKSRINEPISAILTLNTISNTAGAAIAGALAADIFGSRRMGLFTISLTLLILVFAEIIPKTLGASYWKNIAGLTAWVLQVLVYLLKPITIPVNFIARLFTRKGLTERVSKEEVFNAIQLGYLHGVIDSSEFEIVKNLFKLKAITVREIMTPRTVVSWFEPHQTTREALADRRYLQFSRIPLYDPKENHIEGIVLRRDIMSQLAHNKMSTPLKDLATEPETVIETMSVFVLLDRFISRKAHLAIVINEYGDYTGIVTMEDAVETLLGREIVDESDRVVDMRALAKKRMQERFRQ
jgi:CBS domain containing-hemolysin-like protein